MNLSKAIGMSILVAGSVMNLAAGGTKKAAEAEKGKKGILVVSFGTSYAETLTATIEATEKHIASVFPEHEVRRAFTSSIIIKIWKGRGIAIDTVPEALQKMKDQGFSEVIVQPLHLIPGEEYHQVLMQAQPFRTSFPRFAVGEPLFTGTDSYFETLKAVAADLPEIGEHQAVVFMGHGTHHPANAAYSMMQLVFEEMGLPVYVGTVEGYPTLEGVMKKLKGKGITKTIVRPLMLVAGDHANNDMAGDEKDSWKTILKDAGFDPVTVLRGLGEIPSVQELYATRASSALKSLDDKEKTKP